MLSKVKLFPFCCFQCGVTCAWQAKSRLERYEQYCDYLTGLSMTPGSDNVLMFAVCSRINDVCGRYCSHPKQSVDHLMQLVIGLDKYEIHDVSLGYGSRFQTMFTCSLLKNITRGINTLCSLVNNECMQLYTSIYIYYIIYMLIERFKRQ